MEIGNRPMLASDKPADNTLTNSATPAEARNRVECLINDCGMVSVTIIPDDARQVSNVLDRGMRCPRQVPA